MNPTAERTKGTLDSIRQSNNNGQKSREVQQLEELLSSSPPEQHAQIARKLWHSAVSEHLESGEPMPQDLIEQCNIVFEKIFDDVTTAAAVAHANVAYGGSRT